MTIAELESVLDRTYLRHPLPHPNRVLATWYYLTASEDFQRNVFTGMGGEMPAGRMIFYLDKLKYSMRYALDRVAKECTDHTWSDVPCRVESNLYLTAGRLVSAGIDYSLASQLCGALHTGTAVAIKDDDAWRVRIDESHHDKAYGALELIGLGKPGGPDFSMQLFHWIRDPLNAPAVVRQIGESILLKKRLISYAYLQDLTSELARHIGQPTYLIPDAWKFRWGGRSEVSLRPAAAAAMALNRALSGDSVDHWVTTGVVLIAGFGGMRSPDARYPIIPVRLFERAMAEASSLDALVAWCEGLEWLPREGKHFNVATMEIELADSKPLIAYSKQSGQ